MKYLFNTVTTMKPYNRDKYWIDRNYVTDKTILAADSQEALRIYREKVNDDMGIEISRNALKQKQPMYRDRKSGESIQVGYVITGKTEIQTDDYRNPWSTQYVDLWVEIVEIHDIDFPEQEYTLKSA